MKRLYPRKNTPEAFLEALGQELGLTIEQGVRGPKLVRTWEPAFRYTISLEISLEVRVIPGRTAACEQYLRTSISAPAVIASGSEARVFANLIAAASDLALLAEVMTEGHAWPLDPEAP